MVFGWLDNLAEEDIIPGAKRSVRLFLDEFFTMENFDPKKLVQRELGRMRRERRIRLRNEAVAPRIWRDPNKIASASSPEETTT